MQLGTKKITLFITPVTKVYTHYRDRQILAMSDDSLEKYPRLKQRKARILRYLQYKKDLKVEAARVGFEMPSHGVHVKFYMPVPRSWRPKKKRQKDFEPHTSRPDVSNLYKAFEDALLREDMVLWDVRISKYWYNSVKGFISVEFPVMVVPAGGVELQTVAESKII
jgi:Holliday junction resolvase RusA-like endonuclease